MVLLAVPFYLFSFIFTFSATHILSAWVGLELNLISFVGMLVLSNKGSLDSGSMKYFVSQALGSIILIMSILLSLSLMPISAGALLFGASLLLKLGLFPFHAWFISFISSCEFSYLWAVSIPQKMLPFWVMLSMPANTPLVTFGGLVSIMVSVSSVVKTSRLSLILGYSSLMNSGWFMLLLRDLSLFCLLFFLYGLALGGVTWSLKQNKGKSQFSQTSKSQSWLGALGFCLLFMNLGGLPPFFNMWNKFLLLAELYYGSNLVLLSLFILSAGVFLYMYLSLSIWGASLNKGSNSSWFSGLSKPPILLLFIGSLIPFFI